MRRHVCGPQASWPVPVDSGTSSAQHVPAFTLGSEPEPRRPAFLGFLLRALEGLDCCPQASPLWATPRAWSLWWPAPPGSSGVALPLPMGTPAVVKLCQEPHQQQTNSVILSSLLQRCRSESRVRSWDMEGGGGTLLGSGDPPLFRAPAPFKAEWENQCLFLLFDCGQVYTGSWAPGVGPGQQ